MRIPNAEHERLQTELSGFADDFELLDVWDLPVEGGPHDFAAVLHCLTTIPPDRLGSPVTKALFAVRWALGRALGWDTPAPRPIPEARQSSLADRLPAHLCGSADVRVGRSHQPAGRSGFVPLFRTDDEWAAEISNGTVHGVLQLCWVPQPGGRRRARMAVYVKPRGRFGRVYLACIAPFRHRIVYPALLRAAGRAWSEHLASPAAAAGPVGARPA